LRQQLLRIGEQGADMIPNDPFQLITINMSPWARLDPGGLDAVFARTAIDVPLNAGC
jgi:hypothetical protein